jgi:hypothetical protein
MQEHTYREIRLKNGTRKLVITFADERFDLLAEFMQAEADEYGERILAEADAVLDGVKKEGRITCSQYRIALFPSFSVIYDDSDALSWCQTDTVDLYNLLIEWNERTQQMKQHQ